MLLLPHIDYQHVRIQALLAWGVAKGYSYLVCACRIPTKVYPKCRDKPLEGPRGRRKKINNLEADDY